FLLLLGIAAAEASQITGSLLVFALLVLPPATAQVITARPLLGICLSVVLGVAVTWAGLAMAYYTPYPTATFITTLSFAAYVAAGVDLRFGLFGATSAVAVGMGLLGRSGRADDVVIGSVFAWMLGLGVLFLSIYTSNSSGANGTAGVSVLFGSILGLSAGAARAAALIGAMILGGVLLIARPLLFASLDEAVAAARGVPVRALGIWFLGLVGLAAAETTQAVGALLLLGLLAAPAAAAHHLTTHP